MKKETPYKGGGACDTSIVASHLGKDLTIVTKRLRNCRELNDFSFLLRARATFFAVVSANDRASGRI